MIVVILTIAATYRSHGDGSYLPGIGPAPLRFLPIITNINLTALPPLEMGDDEAEAQSESTETNLSSTNVESTVESATSAAGVTNDVDTVMSSEPPETNPEDAATFVAPSTGYSAVITPQMLTEYLRPASSATNGAGVSVFVPTEVGFMPPSPQPSSQATYKSE